MHPTDLQCACAALLQIALLCNESHGVLMQLQMPGCVWDTPPLFPLVGKVQS